MPKRLCDAISICILLTLLSDGGLFIWLRSASDRRYHDFRRVVMDGTDVHSLRPPQGLGVNGMPLMRDTSTTKGWVIRYASRFCRFCAADEPMWNALSGRLSTRGYSIQILLPSRLDAYTAHTVRPLGSVQIAFVSLDWIKHLQLDATPTILIIKRQGGLVWFHEGTLSSADVSAAVDVADRLR